MPTGSGNITCAQGPQPETRVRPNPRQPWPDERFAALLAGLFGLTTGGHLTPLLLLGGSTNGEGTGSLSQPRTANLYCNIPIGQTSLSGEGVTAEQGTVLTLAGQVAGVGDPCSQGQEEELSSTGLKTEAKEAGRRAAVSSSPTLSLGAGSALAGEGSAEEKKELPARPAATLPQGILPEGKPPESVVVVSGGGDGKKESPGGVFALETQAAAPAVAGTDRIKAKSEASPPVLWENGLGLATASAGTDRAAEPLPVSQATPFLRELLAQAAWRGGNGRQEVTLELKPETLGRVHLTVFHQSGCVSARFEVENHLARDALQAGLAELRQELLDQGVHVSELNVFVGQGATGGNAAFAGQGQGWYPERQGKYHLAFTWGWGAAQEHQSEVVQWEITNGVDLRV